MKRIVVMVLGLMLALTFIGFANAGVLYEANFDDGNLDDWTQIPDSESFLVGNWSIQGGVLECEFDPATGPHGSYLRLDTPTLPDSYSIEFDARMVVPQAHPSSSAIGVKTNFSDWDNYVGHDYRQNPQLPSYDHFILQERINGQFLSGDAPYPEYLHMVAFNTDETQWHHVKHVKDGTLFSFFFDDQLIYTYELPVPITGGHLVLRTSPGTNQIDNLLVTTPDPLAHYKLDGDFTDASGHGYDLTHAPGFTYSWVLGKYGQGVDIPWQQAYDRSKEAPHAGGLHYPGTGGLTIMGWTYVEPGKCGYIIQQFTPLITHHIPYRLMLSSAGDFSFRIEASDTTRVVVTYPMADYMGNWVHVAGVYDYQSSVKLYVNGELKASQPTSLIPETLTDYYTYVGGNTWGSECAIVLDEVKLYSYALTEEGIRDAMVGPEPEPVEIDLGLRRFRIRKDKVTGRTVLILRGLPDLPELDLMHGDTVGATITIQLFDVFPDEGDLIISGEEPALRVKDSEDVLVIRKPRF